MRSGMVGEEVFEEPLQSLQLGSFQISVGIQEYDAGLQWEQQLRYQKIGFGLCVGPGEAVDVAQGLQD